MALWFVAFGGTITLGNLAFGPIMDAIGARWVMLVGAVFALFLAWWCDIAKIDRSVSKGRNQPLQPDHTATFDEEGLTTE